MRWLIVGIGLIGIVLLLNSLVMIPTVCFAVVTRFKKRVKDAAGKYKILEEGLNLIFPFIDNVEIFSKKSEPKSVSVNVFSEDRLPIVVNGLVEWKIDRPDIFIELKEGTVIERITAAVKSELGKVAGTKDGDTFIKLRAELEALINCVLRLPRRPDHWVNLKDSSFKMGEINLKGFRGEKRKKLKPKKWKTPALNKEKELDVIGFYKENVTRIQILLRSESKIPEQRSLIEELYGIDVIGFRLEDVDYTEATKKALEKERQTKADMKAAEVRMKTKLQMTKDFQGSGLSPQEALNATETTVGDGERRIISMEGSDNPLIAAAAIIAAKGGNQ